MCMQCTVQCTPQTVRTKLGHIFAMHVIWSFNKYILSRSVFSHVFELYFIDSLNILACQGLTSASALQIINCSEVKCLETILLLASNMIEETSVELSMEHLLRLLCSVQRVVCSVQRVVCSVRSVSVTEHLIICSPPHKCLGFS